VGEMRWRTEARDAEAINARPCPCVRRSHDGRRVLRPWRRRPQQGRQRHTKTGMRINCGTEAASIRREQFPRNFLVANVTRISCVSDVLRRCYEILATFRPSRHVQMVWRVAEIYATSRAYRARGICRTTRQSDKRAALDRPLQ